MHVLGPDRGSKWHSFAPCLLAPQWLLSTPLLSLVTCHYPPPSPPRLHSLFSPLHTPHRASSHWCPSSWRLPVRAPTARANFLSQSEIFETVQDATSSPYQIFEPSVQTPPEALAKFSSQSKTPPAARAKFSSQSNATLANFRASPRPLRTASTKTCKKQIGELQAAASGGK
jgi:hypothetical protein